MQFYPAAVMNLIQVEKASYEELEKIAIRCGFNLSDYEETKRR